MAFELYLYHKKSSEFQFFLTICPPDIIDDDAIFNERALSENYGELVC